MDLYEPINMTSIDLDKPINITSIDFYKPINITSIDLSRTRAAALTTTIEDRITSTEG
jgi:hypothetical protein